MKQFLLGATALTMTALPALAGGLDRSGQPVGLIFEDGNYAELSYARIMPSVTGNDVAMFGGRDTGSIAGNHDLPGFGIKYDINDRLSVAFKYDHDYGADITYPLGDSIALGGTSAFVRSEGYTAIARYKFDQGFSIHAGLRATNASANVTLKGPAYGGFDGYNFKGDSAWGTGYLIGAAWEKPEIAARVALTYFSKVEHNFASNETINGVPMDAILAANGLPTTTGRTKVNTPEALNLDFQTGVAENTLVFGSVRYAKWGGFTVAPEGMGTLSAALTGTAAKLVELEDDSTTWTLGVGRKFNDNWSGSAFITYEGKGDKLVSPLTPTNGYTGFGLAAVYTRDNMKITMGGRYLMLGDADPSTADTARAEMKDNHALALGVKVGFTF